MELPVTLHRRIWPTCRATPCIAHSRQTCAMRAKTTVASAEGAAGPACAAETAHSSTWMYVRAGACQPHSHLQRRQAGVLRRREEDDGIDIGGCMERGWGRARSGSRRAQGPLWLLAAAALQQHAKQHMLQHALRCPHRPTACGRRSPHPRCSRPPARPAAGAVWLGE